MKKLIKKIGLMSVIFAMIIPFVELPEYLDSCSGGGSMTAPHTWKYQCLYVNEADEIFYAGWPYETRGEGGC